MEQPPSGKIKAERSKQKDLKPNKFKTIRELKNKFLLIILKYEYSPNEDQNVSKQEKSRYKMNSITISSLEKSYSLIRNTFFLLGYIHTNNND